MVREKEVVLNIHHQIEVAYREQERLFDENAAGNSDDTAVTS